MEANSSPLVRIEMEYADGTIQRLTGPPAEHWLKEVNDVIVFTTVRCGQQQISDYDWQWTDRKTVRKADELGKFDNYEGTD